MEVVMYFGVICDLLTTIYRIYKWNNVELDGSYVLTEREWCTVFVYGDI